MVLIGIATTVNAEDRAAVLGHWAGEDSIIEVAENAGTLSAKIVSMLDPLYKENEDGPVGTPRVDLKNPDASLRARRLMGLDLLSAYEFKKNKWQGNLYDPESGKTYKSQLTVDDGKLQMRGYIGTPMLGRTEEWTPVSACAGNTPKMLASAKLPPCA